MRLRAAGILLSACLAPSAFAASISGAIFTTDTDGNVNVNQYENKADVYLNGGPTNSNCNAAAIPDDTYVFQVTNPSGSVVLSSDTIDHREFTVVGGVAQFANDHAIDTVDPPCSGVRVQLAPFDDTPNNGGVYKVWITRKSDYIANGGFKNSDSKTDNFHVKLPSEQPQTADISIYKFYDANANGDWDPDEQPIFGWLMTLGDSNGGSGAGLTQSPDGIVSFLGMDPTLTYSVTEGLGGGTWHQSASIVNGTPTGTPTNPVTGLTLTVGETTIVEFGNYCDCKSGGKPKSWWITASGQTKVNDGGTMNPEFNALNQLNLRSSSGSNWNLTTTLATPTQAQNWTTFVNWVNNASTTNMAYALSRQVAILRLNIDAGYVTKENYYKAAGLTIQGLLDEANLALGADGNTPVGDPNRAVQEQLLAWITAINGGTVLVIKPKPCPFVFTLPTPPT
ncbi:hypothetical protein LF41_2876 [Lysobacter dokdonensis DS-58]|uniref:Uncharacterized protein n=1 Tax=Lysobacter dokdonensis DS-58 TaxID=1300345 RepID=A0A0A2WLU2_9GAMM|nr:hypothetical protein [Lysobacter dokdonensis]KGQ19230.1 hypothetical protein LF41_2876 [Lysobacter dokdonensis DS-58]